MLNRSVLVGRLTRDPELRRTANGTPVASFTLAVNRNFKNQNGEQQADFIPCVVWNKSAENVDQYCSKGALVGVDGHLQSRSYDNQNGQKVFVLELVCDSVQFIDTKNKQNLSATDQNAFNPYSNMEQSKSSAQGNFEANYGSNDSFNIMDDDIQF